MTSWQNDLHRNPHIDRFFEHLTFKTKKTQETYLWILKGIIDFFEADYSEFDPKSLNQKMYRQLLMKKSEKCKKSTLNLYSKIFSVLSTLYDLKIEVELLKEIDRFTDYLRFEELHEIVQNADKEVSAITSFMFCTGLRPISVASIKKPQLMLTAKNPYVRNVYLKGGKRRDVPILYPEIVIPLLRWYLQFKSQKNSYYEEIDWVFISQKGASTVSYIYFTVRRASEVVGRPVYPRMLRKGLGVHTKELGMQDNVRRMLLGHNDIQTTIRAYSEYETQDIFREFEGKRSNLGMFGDPRANYVSNNRENVNRNSNMEKCPFCGRFVEHEMLLCPYCGKDIKAICNTCQRYVSTAWEVCPYCKTPIKQRSGYKKGMLYKEQ